MSERRSEKRLSWPAKLALMTGLSLAPKQEAVEARPTVNQMQLAQTQTAEAVHVATLRRQIESERATETQYPEQERANMLTRGREIGERTYSSIVSVDNLALEPQELLQRAEHSINQEVDRVTKSGSSEEEISTYRERLAAIAQDVILLKLRQEALPRLQQTSPNLVDRYIEVFSQWDVTNQILPSQFEDQVQADERIRLRRRDNVTIASELTPLNQQAEDELIIERVFGDLDNQSSSGPDTLDPTPEQG